MDLILTKLGDAVSSGSRLDYVDCKFYHFAIVRINCTIVRVIEPQRLGVVLRNGILKERI
jgi:hypothetical protein